MRLLLAAVAALAVAPGVAASMRCYPPEVATRTLASEFREGIVAIGRA